MQNLDGQIVPINQMRHTMDQDGTMVLEERSRQAVLDACPEAADMEIVWPPLEYLEHVCTVMGPRVMGPEGPIPLLSLFSDAPDYPWKRRYRQQGGPTGTWFRAEDIPRHLEIVEPSENRNPRPVHGPRPGLQTEDTQGVSSPQNGPEQWEVL